MDGLEALPVGVDEGSLLGDREVEVDDRILAVELQLDRPYRLVGRSCRLRCHRGDRLALGDPFHREQRLVPIARPLR